MTGRTIEDYDRLARGNEDRFNVIEDKLNRALELLGEGNVEKATEFVDDAAHDAGKGARDNLVAGQKAL